MSQIQLTQNNISTLISLRDNFSPPQVSKTPHFSIDDFEEQGVADFDADIPLVLTKNTESTRTETYQALLEAIKAGTLDISAAMGLLRNDLDPNYSGIEPFLELAPLSAEQHREIKDLILKKAASSLNPVDFTALVFSTELSANKTILWSAMTEQKKFLDGIKDTLKQYGIPETHVPKDIMAGIQLTSNRQMEWHRGQFTIGGAKA